MSAVAVFVAGLALLLASGHFVVSAASRIGEKFGLTPMVVGLTIVAAGTSAPELAVVAQAVAAKDTELAVGSVIGSNIANVLLVLGLAAALGSIKVTNRVVRIDIPVMIGASIGLLVMAQDGNLSRTNGTVMVTALIVFVLWTLKTAPKTELHTTPLATDVPAGLNIAESASSATEPNRERPIYHLLLILAVGVGGLAIAARFVVGGAEDLATTLGIPELIVGLTVVALGTSAPEIVTTIIAARQGRRDLAVGNAVGSNIFNILLVLGSISVFAPGGINIGIDAVDLDLPILVAAAVACLPMVFFDNTLNRWEGAVFVGYYLAYLAFLVLDATGHRAKDPFVLVMYAFVVPLTILTIATITYRGRKHRAQPPKSPVKTKPAGINSVGAMEGKQ